MAKLILHIGMQKTGSSAIQSALANASGKGFIYPMLAGPPFKPHHTDALIELFSGAREVLVARKARLGKTVSASDEDIERIRRAAADAGSGAVILSSEGAYSYMSVEDLVNFRRFAEQLFDSITIVGYVREPFSFVSSNFHNKIKSSRLARFALKFPHYRFFEKFDEVFGRENVQLWEYDRKRLLNGNVVDDFCSKLGIVAASSQEMNVTLSRPAVSAIYRLNRIIARNDRALPAYHKAREAIIEDFPHADWPKFRLSPVAIRPLVAANREEMAWIEERLGSPSFHSEPAPLETDVASEADLLKMRSRPAKLLRRIGRTLPLRSRRLVKHAVA